MKKVTLSIMVLLLTCGAYAQKNNKHYHGKIIDMHVHIAVQESEIHSISAERTITLSAIRKGMTKSGITRSAVITIAWTGNIPDTRMRNDSIIALYKKNPSLIPICSVHPLDGDSALSEMTRLHKLGVKIIKLHPNAQKFDVSAPEVTALADKATELHMTLLFDSYNPSDVNELGKLIMLAATHQDAQFIFAHMGLVNFPQLLTIEALKKYPWYKKNIWMDISAVAPILGNSPFHDQLMWVIRKIGIDQFLFGSDYPT
jgi:predicted TIM-barrel fold metal-dependent hydrolase